MNRIALVICILLLGACARPADHASNDAPAQAKLDAGRQVYNFRCYYCHGYSGNARTLAATFISPAPRDFTAGDSARLKPQDIAAVVRHGRPGTAMPSFGRTLTDEEIDAVAAFVHDEFVRRRAENTRYHTAENGWPDHERYRSAFPFARGELPIDTPASDLSEEQLAGRRLFMSTCISCHDRSRVNDHGATWELQAVSYPPNRDACAGCHRYATALHGRTGLPPLHTAASAGPYDRHDHAPAIDGASERVARGEALFQKSCSFCHAADGTGRNWIGTFLEPHPRDLTTETFHQRTTPRSLIAAIRNGVPGSAMPAWKHVLKPDEVDAIAAYVLTAFRPRASADARR